MLSNSPAPAALANRARNFLSSSNVIFSCRRPPVGFGRNALTPPLSYAMCVRFTVLKDTLSAQQSRVASSRLRAVISFVSAAAQRVLAALDHLAPQNQMVLEESHPDSCA